MSQDTQPKVLYRSVSVSGGGRLLYSVWVCDCFHVKSSEDGEVPVKIVKSGYAAVVRYVDAIIQRIWKNELAARETYRLKFESNFAQLSVVHQGQKINGVMRPSTKPGLATFDVELVFPKKYHATKTLYESKYPALSKGLLEKDGTASQKAVDQASELLIEIYKHAKHKEAHALTYGVAQKVNETLKGKVT